MPDLSEALAGIHFVAHLGIEVLAVEEGRAQLALNVRPFMRNSWNVTHGGVTMTLMDVCMSLAGRSMNPSHLIGVTVEMKVNFLAPGSGERLIATARAFPQGRSLFCSECEVTAPDGTLIARGLGTFKLRKRQPDDRPVVPGGQA
jgi:acyl-CoA thioesterase